MKKILFFLLLILFFLQISFLPALGIGRSINLLLAFFLACSMIFDFNVAILVVIVGATLNDFYSNCGFGIIPIAAVAASLLALEISKKFLSDKKNILIVFAILTISGIAHSLLEKLLDLIYFELRLQPARCLVGNLWGFQFWIEVAMTSLVGTIMVLLLDKIKKTLFKDQIEL
jgi:hypothetical protein